MQSSIDPSVLDICTLRPLLSCEVSSTFPAGSIVDEQLECPDLQERMRAIGAALVLRQLLNQRGCGLSAISENSPDIGLGLSPGQMAALWELELRAVEVIVRPGPMGKKRPLTPGGDIPGVEPKAMKQQSASAGSGIHWQDPWHCAIDAPDGISGTNIVPGSCPLAWDKNQVVTMRQLIDVEMATQRAMSPSPGTASNDLMPSALPGGETPPNGGHTPGEASDDLSDMSITLRPLLPDSLAKHLPKGGIGDRLLRCPEAAMRTQLMFAQWVALQLLNEMSRLEGVQHNGLWEATQWCYKCNIFDDMHLRVFKHINGLGNAAKHLPMFDHGDERHGAHVGGKAYQALRTLASQLPP